MICLGWTTWTLIPSSLTWSLVLESPKMPQLILSARKTFYMCWTWFFWSDWVTWWLAKFANHKFASHWDLTWVMLCEWQCESRVCSVMTESEFRLNGKVTWICTSPVSTTELWQNTKGRPAAKSEDLGALHFWTFSCFPAILRMKLQRVPLTLIHKARACDLGDDRRAREALLQSRWVTRQVRWACVWQSREQQDNGPMYQNDPAVGNGGLSLIRLLFV